MQAEETSEPSQPAQRSHAWLPAHVDSVPRARRFVTDTLRAWHCHDADGIVALLTSEVVTNAVRFAREEVQVALSLGPEGVVLVEAVDDHPAAPTLHPMGPDQEGGRGMWLVEKLARRWGAEPLPDGRKMVWFEVRLGVPPSASDPQSAG